MTTRFNQSDAGTVLRLEEEIQITDAAALKAVLLEALAACRDIGLNLDGVTAMDVTAMQLLISCEGTARAAGLTFELNGELPRILLSVQAAMGLQDFPGQRSAE